MENKIELSIEEINEAIASNKMIFTCKVGQQYNIVIRKHTTQLLGCSVIPGVTFEFGKSFIRPDVVKHLKTLEEQINKNNSAKIMIFGHTDSVGNDDANKKLSERRALSVYSFITDNAEEWEILYNKEEWGTREIQTMLVDFGTPYDPGPVDGIAGEKTKAAIKQFQLDNGLEPDSIAGPITRKTMFLRYMTGKHDIKLTSDNFISPNYHGCGEFNPLIKSECADERNRRVTFYLFHPEKTPVFPCNHGNIEPCQKKIAETTTRHSKTFRCSFYDSIAKDCTCENGTSGGTISILLKDPQGNLLKNTPFELSFRGATINSKTDENGRLKENVAAGVTSAELKIRAWTMNLSFEKMDIVSQIKGAKVRLNNLGFFTDNPVNEENSEAFKFALQRFQTFYNLNVTAELDEPTQKKIEEIHGS